MNYRITFVALLALAAAATANAQSDGMKGAHGAVHKATGVVAKVENDKVTIKHGPVPTINWPSMTMAFKVKDKALIGKLAKDKKVDFEFKQEGRDYVVTSVK